MKYAGMVVVGSLLLGACVPASDTRDATEGTSEEQLVEGINIANARMVLAPVTGNPAAVYFDLTYVGDESVTFDSAVVEGAQSTMIHIISKDDTGTHMMDMGPFELTPGETLEFKPGELHIMAMDVSPEVEAGSSTNVTLTLSDGTMHSFDAEVRSAGDER
ncbi:MAG: copper chaperone PCu(A)C [Pseudomonadota bacterium]